MRYFLVFAILVIAGLAVWIIKAPQKNDAVLPAPEPSATGATGAAATPPESAATKAEIMSKTPPDTIQFVSAKEGNVTFTHKLHYERVKGDCTVCHVQIFPQSRAPLNYGRALHRVAEAERTSCAYCHAVGGSAFAADSNCVKCHMKQFPNPD